MATNCLDKILCENAWECSVNVTDTEGNPIDTTLIHPGDTIVIVLGEKIGHKFLGFVDENGDPISYTTIEEGKYSIIVPLNGCSSTIFAQYCRKVYEVSKTSNSGCMQPSTTIAPYGSIVTVSASDTYNCHFLRWERDGNTVTESNSFEYVVTENVVFVAVYDSVYYRITGVPMVNGSGYVTGGGVYSYGSTVTLHAEPNNGYTFVSWDDYTLQNPRTVTVTGNAIYKADFMRVENSINTPRGTGGGAIGSGTYPKGSVATLIPTPDKGYSFSHWVVNGNTTTEEVLKIVVNNNVTAQPVFVRTRYTLNLVVNPSNSGYFTRSNNNATYEYGDTVTVTAVPNAGYRFVSWSDGVTNNERTITMNGDISLGASFEEAASTLTLSVNLPDSTYNCNIYYGLEQIGVKNDDVVTATVDEGTLVYLEPSMKEGKRFVSFTSNDVTIAPATDYKEYRFPYVVTEDITFTANYEDISYKLTLLIDPVDEHTSGECQIDVTINTSTSFSFTPTEQVPILTYTLPLSQNVIALSAPQTLNNGMYEFSYWRTTNGSYIDTTPTISSYGDIECLAVYRQIN